MENGHALELKLEELFHVSPHYSLAHNKPHKVHMSHRRTCMMALFYINKDTQHGVRVEKPDYLTTPI